jgi:hypothetical protein
MVAGEFEIVVGSPIEVQGVILYSRHPELPGFPNKLAHAGYPRSAMA